MKDFKPGRNASAKPRRRGWWPLRRKQREARASRPLGQTRQRGRTMPAGFQPLPKPEQGRKRERRAIVPALAALLAPAAVLLRYPARLAFAAVMVWMAAGLVLTGARAWQAPVQRVAVEGAEALDVRALARQAGLRAGMAIGALDPYETSRALADHPWVARADVRRVAPDAALVWVQERRPRLQVALGEGRTMLLDAEQVALTPAEEALPEAWHGLPLVHGVEAPAEPGRQVDDPALRQAWQVLQALEALGPDQDRGAVITAGNPQSLAVRLPARGVRLLLPPDGLGRALDAYLRLVPVLPAPGSGVQTIDLRLLESAVSPRVIVRPGTD